MILLKWSLSKIKVKPGFSSSCFQISLTVPKSFIYLMTFSNHFPVNFIPISSKMNSEMCSKITAEAGKDMVIDGKTSVKDGKALTKVGKMLVRAGKRSEKLGKKLEKPGKRSLIAGKTSEEFGKTSEIDGKGLIM